LLYESYPIATVHVAGVQILLSIERRLGGRRRQVQKLCAISGAVPLGPCMRG
jgi:hypothetical protein